MTPKWRLGVGGILAAWLSFDPAAAQHKSGAWQILPDLPNPRRLLAAATVDDTIYTFGGCGSPCFDPVLHPSTFEETLVEVYDPGLPDAPWSARSPIPSVFFGGAAAALGDFVYLAGGVVSPDVVLRYDPAADSWTTRAPMPTARHGLSMAALGGKLYAVGGNGPSNALEVYDPATDTWTARAPMPTARVFLAAAALGGKLYVAGGSPDCCGDSQTDVLEIYDPATDSWTTGAPMPVAQQLSAAVAFHDQIYTFGGFVPGGGARANVYGYDPAAGVWIEKTAMPTARDQSAAALLDDAAHILGGSVDCHCTALAAHERYVADGIPPTETEIADLAVTKTNSVDEVSCEAPPYTITVTNLGPVAVDDAILRDNLPDELGDVAWSCPGCVPSSGTSRDLECVLDLLPGETLTCTASGTLDPAATGRLVNTAIVTPPTDVVDPEPGNNSATDDDPIVRTTDLAITKTNGTDEVLACTETPPYVITVTNLGTCPVDGATVRDEFPPELIDPEWTCEPSAGATCSPDGEGDLDDTIFLPPGGTVTYIVLGRVSDDAEGMLENTASVLPPAAVMDIDLGNNEATDIDDILRTADLEITKTNLVDPVYACELVSYRIEVINNGPCPVEGARIFDELPEDLPGILPIDETVDLEAGESVELTAAGIVAKDAGDSLENTATVSAPVGIVDPEPGNNSATVVDPIWRRDADLEVVKSRDDDVLWPGGGDLLTYTIEVTNNGPTTAECVRITDDFPDTLEGVTWTCEPAAFCDGPELGDLDEVIDLDPGGSVTYIATGIVGPFDVGRICNTATVSTMGCFTDAMPENDASEACLLIHDCNDNGIRDALDIENGVSADVNGDHIPDECQVGTIDFELSGVAEGGTVVITFEGISGLFPTCTIVVPTVAGQTAETVAANVAAAINSDPCLAGQDVVAIVIDGTTVCITGFLVSYSRVSIEIDDPGLSFGIPVWKIPTLSAWGLGLLALLVAAAGLRTLAVRRR